MKSLLGFEADLHCHTTASDGVMTPEEVVILAESIGLKALAVTDHDTINGWDEAEKKARQTGVYILRGIEINTDGKEKEVHILGYGLKRENPFLKEKLNELQEKRVVRTKEILDKLAKMGMELPYQEVLKYAKGESVGRPHIAQAMIGYGYADNFKEAFGKYLKMGSPAYIPRRKVTPSVAIQIIREAGGVAVLAHPGNRISEEEIRQWIEQGLQGIEVSHPDHSPQDTKRYKNMARKFQLIATGGSDFHGPGIKSGIHLGEWGVGLEVIDLIEKAKDQ